MTARGFDGDNIYLRSDVLNTVTGVEALGSRQKLGELRAVPVNASTVMRDPQIWVPLPGNSRPVCGPDPRLRWRSSVGESGVGGSL